MTEKIARRGIFTPHAYEPDILTRVNVSQVINENVVVLSAQNTIAEVRAFFKLEFPKNNHFLVTDESGAFCGAITVADIWNKELDSESSVKSIVRDKIPFIGADESLATAVELMSKYGREFLPVVSPTEKNVINGLLTYKDILKAYKIYFKENQEAGINLSLKRQRIKMLIRGRKLINAPKIKMPV